MTRSLISAAPAAHDSWRQVDWQRQMREIKIDNDVLSYVELGHGKPVLAIHGLGGNWAVWLQNLPELASGYRVIAIDLPGFGRSGPSGHGVAISGYSRLVSSLVDELALERPVLVGNSLGGWIAADVALRVPDRVGGLVLVDAGGVVPTAAERRRSLLMMGGAARLAPFAPRFRGAIASRRRLRWIALRSTFARPAEVAGDLVYMAMPAAPDPAFRPALLAAKRSWSEAWCHRLSEIACPTLIVWGDRDALLPVRHAREYARRIVGSQLRIIPDAGHLPMMERPREFNRLVLEFLDRVS